MKRLIEVRINYNATSEIAAQAPLRKEGVKALAWVMLLLAVLALPVGVRAQDYQFATDGNAITITKYIGGGGEVTIPEKINGLPVTSIGDGVFSGCPSRTHAPVYLT